MAISRGAGLWTVRGSRPCPGSGSSGAVRPGRKAHPRAAGSRALPDLGQVSPGLDGGRRCNPMGGPTSQWCCRSRAPFLRVTVSPWPAPPGPPTAASSAGDSRHSALPPGHRWSWLLEGLVRVPDPARGRSISRPGGGDLAAVPRTLVRDGAARSASWQSQLAPTSPIASGSSPEGDGDPVLKPPNPFLTRHLGGHGRGRPCPAGGSALCAGESMLPR